MVEAALSLDRLFQAIQIQGAFVDAWEAVERVSVLFVKFRELIEVVVTDTVATFYRVELLATGPEVKALWNVVSSYIVFDRR